MKEYLFGNIPKRDALETLQNKDLSKETLEQQQRLDKAYSHFRTKMNKYLATQDESLYSVASILKSLPQTIPTPLVTDIAKTLAQTSEVLHVPIPEVSLELRFAPILINDKVQKYESPEQVFRQNDLTIAMEEDGNDKEIMVNIFFLAELINDYMRGSKEKRTAAKNTVRKTFAEEMFHVYHSERYPTTFFQRTGIIYQIEDQEENAHAYQTDRGEILAHGFGERYAAYCQGHPSTSLS